MENAEVDELYTSSIRRAVSKAYGYFNDTLIMELAARGRRYSSLPFTGCIA
jgi:hypothetical protein